MVNRDVMVTYPVPNSSAASAITRASSAVMRPLRVITRPLKRSGVFLSHKKPKAFTRVTSSGETAAPADATFTSLNTVEPSST